MSDERDALHIGNLVCIHSTKYGRTTGLVSYRSNSIARIRVRSDNAVDFHLCTGAESGEFAEDMGVTSIELLEEQESDVYVDFLGAQVGDVLEFFSSDGTEAAPSGRIAAFSRSRARITLNDGSTIGFHAEDHVGPPAPIAVARIRAVPALPLPPPAGAVAPPDLHVAGLTLAGFERVIAAAGGRAALAGVTTAALKAMHVLPLTREEKVSYVEHLQCGGHAVCVGPATQFISHAYGDLFLNSIDAVAAWEARKSPDSGPQLYYFDLLVVNQHNQSVGVSPTVLWEEFAGGVRRVGHTLLVLSWSAAALPLTRAWCLAEVVTGVGDAGGLFEVVLPPHEEECFRAELVANFDAAASKTCSVNLATPTAYHGGKCLVDGVCRHVSSGELAVCPDDLSFVRDSVARELGFDEANARVVAKMQSWMFAAGAAALASLPRDERDGSALAFAYARLLLDTSRGSLELSSERILGVSSVSDRMLAARRNRLALAMCDAAYVARLDKYEPHAPEVLDVLRLRAAALEACHGSDRQSVVGQIYETVYTMREAALGPHHPDTLRSRFDLICFAYDHGDSGHITEIPLLRTDVLRGMRSLSRLQRRVLGDAHPDTLEGWVRLAQFTLSLYENEEEIDENFEAAESAVRTAVDGLLLRFGRWHPLTLEAMQHLAVLLFRAYGGADEVVSLYMQVIEVRKRTLGPRHHFTLALMATAAALLEEVGDEDAAAPLRQE